VLYKTSYSHLVPNRGHDANRALCQGHILIHICCIRNIPKIRLSSRRHPVCQPICFTVTVPSFVDIAIFPSFDRIPKYGIAKYRFPFGMDTSPYKDDPLQSSPVPVTEMQNRNVDEDDTRFDEVVVSMQYPPSSIAILSNPRFNLAYGAYFISYTQDTELDCEVTHFSRFVAISWATTSSSRFPPSLLLLLFSDDDVMMGNDTSKENSCPL